MSTGRRLILKGLTRREFFNRYSKETLRDFLSGWHNYNNEANRLSCEDVAMRLGRKAQKNLKLRDNKMKGGI